MAQWRLTGHRYDPDFVPPGLDRRFVSARRAAKLVPDYATVLSCGMAAFHPASVLYWAIRDRYEAEGSPRELTWCGVTGAGGRGKATGTIEEVGRRGLVRRAILGHVETVRSFLELAERGDIELHVLPQGQYAALVEAQGRGEFELESEVGLGTFLDPRVGRGSVVTPPSTEQFVRAKGDRLRYSLPQLDVHLFNAPYADRAGNIYVDGAAVLTEIRDGARAVHRNGGTVIACVSDVVDERPADVYVPAEWVDAIVVSPSVSQLHSVPQRRAWPMFTPGAAVDPASADHELRFVNRVTGAAPKRRPIDTALARAAASLVAPLLDDGALVNIGTGLPEEVGRILGEQLDGRIALSTEAGAIGGRPASGLFFGAAVNPIELVSSAEIFARYRDALALTCVGMLEIDGRGNVNVSRRGESARDYVGPGGFPDITTYAKTVLFVGSFAVGEELRFRGGRTEVVGQGNAKFVKVVREITFNAAAALERGQRVFYATHRGLFRLTERGLELISVPDGIDVKRDVLSAPAEIVLPEAGPEVVHASAVALASGTGSA